ncbi:hypothetical protein DITRI_Ditri06bG0044800 [Diplodiscus trichospermus]
MSSNDHIYADLSPINSAGISVNEPYEPESDTSKAQEEVNQPSLSPNHSRKKLNPRRKSSNGANMKRRRQSEAGESIKKARSGFEIGESSAPQQPEPKSKRKEESLKEHINNKPVPQVTKIFRDRVDRQIKKKDKVVDMESCICLLMFAMTYKISGLYQLLADSLNQINAKWPPRSYLKNIKESLKEIEDKNKHDGAGIVSGQTKRRLEEIGDEIMRLDQQRRKDSIKAKNVEESFISEVG